MKPYKFLILALAVVVIVTLCSWLWSIYRAPDAGDNDVSIRQLQAIEKLEQHAANAERRARQAQLDKDMEMLISLKAQVAALEQMGGRKFSDPRLDQAIEILEARIKSGLSPQTDPRPARTVSR